LEDIDVIKSFEEMFSLTFQKVRKFRECRFTLRQEIGKHLKHLMCDEKLDDFIKGVYIMEATEKIPNDVCNFDYIQLIDQHDYQQFHDDYEKLEELSVVCKIVQIFSNLIVLHVKPTRNRRQRQKMQIDPEQPYFVKFIPNRITTRVSHRTLEELINKNIESHLQYFDMKYITNQWNEQKIDDFTWMNTAIAKNNEQQIAIKNIVNRSSFPAPYIIFGGPGNLSQSSY
jgi:hypothetical protein